MNGHDAGLTYFALLVAVALMLVGAVVIFTGPSAGLAIALIAVGVAITAIVETDKRRRMRTH
jgi:uncharacterized membrane protein